MRELNAMQAAAWFGRAHDTLLGGVAAHLYTEFNGWHIDISRLSRAIERLYQRHEILRLQLNEAGEITIMDHGLEPKVQLDDFSYLTKIQQQQRLISKRQQWTHQQLNVHEGQTVRFSISLLSEQEFRLHIDADMIAVDPSSFRVLMEELALWYEDDNQLLPEPPSFFVWQQLERQQPQYLQQQRAAAAWWKKRLSSIAPAPTLPLNSAPAPIDSQRLSTTLSQAQTDVLRGLARQYHLTFSTFLMGLFAYTLGQQTQDATYRLNVPFFFRPPLLADIEHSIGDFAQLVLVNVDMSPTANLAAFCQRLRDELYTCLAHGDYSGVQVLRQLSRQHASLQLAPVVFTAAVDLPGQTLFSPRVHQHFGRMDWCISQGSQVALDVQLVQLTEQLLINWDIRQEALATGWVQQLFKNYNELIMALLHDSALFNQALQCVSQRLNSTSAAVAEIALNDLQKAYLAGRSHAFALGGVAMQEWREYAGTLDLAQFTQRLTAMVQHYPSLRTHIDVQRCVQWVSSQPVVNLTVMDLRPLDSHAAAAKIEILRQREQQALFDLTQSPWQITLLQLTEQQWVLFARFDALILDGRAIATLMQTLLTDTPLPATTVATPSRVTTSHTYAAAQVYWQQKLQAVNSLPALPWQQPLSTLMNCRYARQSQVIAAADFNNLCRFGAKQGLFNNSVLMAIILATLNHWQTVADASMAVAVPVLPLYSGTLSNQSTFIVVTTHPDLPLLAQAQQLQQDILTGLQYLAFSGVDLTRHLLTQHGCTPVLPVVITNGLSWPTLAPNHNMHYMDGLTQTPQVALDIRFMRQADGGLVFNIDYAEDAIALDVITALLAALATLCRSVAQHGLAALDNQAVRALFQLDHAKHGVNQTAAQPSITRVDDKHTQQRQQLFAIYQTVLNMNGSDLNSSTAFSQWGLRLSHLKTITTQINQQFALSLQMRQLLACRNLAEVEGLINSHVSSV